MSPFALKNPQKQSYDHRAPPLGRAHTYYKDEESSHEDGHHNKLQQSKRKDPAESTQTKHCDGKVDGDHAARCNTRHKYEERPSEIQRQTTC